LILERERRRIQQRRIRRDRSAYAFDAVRPLSLQSMDTCRCWRGEYRLPATVEREAKLLYAA